MERLMGSPSLPDVLAARRKALLRLRFVLNLQAAAKLDALVKAAQGRAKSPGKHPPSLERRGGVAKAGSQGRTGGGKENLLSKMNP
jgi:hypothetical protein